jgi:hypothetical protein
LSVPFTQYLRPYGRRTEVAIDLNPETEAKALEILAAGYVFECEELTTGHVSFTIHDPRKQEDVAIQLGANGPEVPSLVTKLIMGFKL